MSGYDDTERRAQTRIDAAENAREWWGPHDPIAQRAADEAAARYESNVVWGRDL